MPRRRRRRCISDTPISRSSCISRGVWQRKRHPVALDPPRGVRKKLLEPEIRRVVLWRDAVGDLHERAHSLLPHQRRRGIESARFQGRIALVGAGRMPCSGVGHHVALLAAPHGAAACVCRPCLSPPGCLFLVPATWSTLRHVDFVFKLVPLVTGLLLAEWPCIIINRMPHTELYGNIQSSMLPYSLE